MASGMACVASMAVISMLVLAMMPVAPTHAVNVATARHRAGKSARGLRRLQRPRLMPGGSSPTDYFLELDSRLKAAETHGQYRRHSRRRRKKEQKDKCSTHYGVVKVKKVSGKPKYIYKQTCDKLSSRDTVAWGVFDDEIMRTGWADLTIKTNDRYDDMQQAFAAGYLEGALTRERIWQISRIILTNHKNKPGVHQFFKRQDEFLRAKIASVDVDAKDEESVYWYNVALVIAQMDGLMEGYNAMMDAKHQLTRWDIWLMQSDGDILDIERIPNKQFPPVHKRAMDMSKPELIEFVSLRGRCSAIIKFVPGKELFAAHTTWDDFNEMYRIYKHYHFNFKHPSVKSRKSSHSSYAGLISSSDDFYILDTGLVAIETTLNVLDEKLYSLCDPSSQVLAWIRNLLANRLGTTGPEWISVFEKYNSGTYNDQWMIVDYKLYDQSLTKLKPNTVWIMEQIPGYFAKKDVSDIVSKMTYWASYNRPFFDEVDKRSMYNHYASIHGTMFSYESCPRAKIFAREQKHTTSVEDMKKLMMFNKWQTDPFSEGCPGNSIASRFDIPAPKCQMPQVANGATDAKLTKSSWIKDFVAVSIGGPTHDDQKPWSWKNPKFSSQYHKGQPTVWNFEWQVMAPAHL